MTQTMYVHVYKWIIKKIQKEWDCVSNGRAFSKNIEALSSTPVLLEKNNPDCIRMFVLWSLELSYSSLSPWFIIHGPTHIGTWHMLVNEWMVWDGTYVYLFKICILLADLIKTGSIKKNMLLKAHFHQISGKIYMFMPEYNICIYLWNS
jgi:hypothetical protein